jgi:hypothetical protein
LNSFPETDYADVLQSYLAFWEETRASIALPYFPNATVGWDASPRTVQSDVFDPVGYPFTSCIGRSSPEAFKTALQAIKTRLASTGTPKIVTINSWNEWTEGSYLEPDMLNGPGYLEAIRAVFGGRDV